MIFSAINGLVNPAPKSLSDTTVTSECDEFAVLFRDAIINIKVSTSWGVNNDV